MIERVKYRGWENCWKFSNESVELIVLADVGPRVIWYGVLGGENQFTKWRRMRGERARRNSGFTGDTGCGPHRRWRGLISPIMRQ